MSSSERALSSALRPQFFQVDNDWAPLLQAFADGAVGQALCASVDARVEAGAQVYPGQVFRAFQATPRSAVRAVILGQDPYHGPGQAEGLAFSVAEGQRWPPSLRNILQEWHRDLGRPLPVSGSLQSWAEQGVLLLNTSLTVEQGLAGSHARLGWQVLTESVMQVLAQAAQPIAFLLWGSHAQAFAPALQAVGHHQVLCCNHPSPLSARRGPAPFLGCGHFGQAARFLATSGRGPLHWSLP